MAFIDLMIRTRTSASPLSVSALYLMVVGGLLTYFSQQPWLFWPACISSLTLAVSAVVVFIKMRNEGNGGRRPRWAFGAGIFCTLVVCCALLIFFWQNIQLPCLR
jgi:apolipoprotein N-acyltransferase